MHKKFKHSNRKSHYDFCVDYDFEKDTPEILVKRIMYSMFIRRRLKRNKPVIIFISGDCYVKGTRVLMANGEWKNIEDIQVDDEVISPQENGTNTFAKVVRTSSYFSQENYQVSQMNRYQTPLYKCSHNHKIPVYHRCIPRINGKRNKEYAKWYIKTYEAQELAKMTDLRTRNIAFTTFPIEQYKDRPNCIIEPYCLGVFIGNGTFLGYNNHKPSLRITSAHPKTMNEVNKYYPIMSKYKKDGTSCLTYAFSQTSSFYSLIEQYGFRNKRSGDKFIPKEAMMSDLNYRKRLLAGLIDTDGSYYHGGYSYVTKSERLANDVRNLVYSVGGRANIRKITKKIKALNFEGQYYHVAIYLHDLELPLQVEHKKKTVDCYYKSGNRIAIKLEKSEPEQVFGITIDSPSHFLIVENWMVSLNSGEGKSYSALKIQEILCEVQGIPFLPHINDINIYTPLQYPEKIRKLLFDETNKNINLVTIHEAREVIKAKTWHSFVTQAISDINATARQVKPVIVMILSQFIRDITTDVRYTLNYYIKVERPPYSNYAELEFMKMWKDDTDLEKPKLCKARIKGLIRLPDGTHKVLRPKFIFTPVSKEVAEIFNKADYDAKKNIIKHKLDKIMKKMIEDIGMTSDKVDKMVKFYCDNPQNLVKIGKMKKNGRKWILNKDFKMMHDLSDGEGNEFATKLYAELNKKGIVESATPSIERGERVEEGLEVPEESEL